MFTLIKAYYKKLAPALTEDAWNKLEASLTVQYLKKGDFLVRQGEVCRQVSFINKGLLRMYYPVDGREICTAFMRENEYIAEYESFLTLQPTAMSIEALEDCELINLSYDVMQAFYKQEPLFEIVGRKIAEMLFIMISSHTTRLLTLTPEDHYQLVVQEKPNMLQRVPQYMIASFIGITPEHLSRLRRKISTKIPG